jgi:hypothetical protein
LNLFSQTPSPCHRRHGKTILKAVRDQATRQDPFQYTTLAFALAVTDFEKQLWNHHCVIEQRESSNARHLVAQAIIDCAHKGIREPDEKRRCAYEDPDRLNRREA